MSDRALFEEPAVDKWRLDALNRLAGWPTSASSGIGRHHGTSRKEPFDRWFRYPAGFASDYVGYLLSRLALQPGQLVVDCFAGSGVCGTAARNQGLGFLGIEAHPMIAELAQLKLGPSVRPDALRARAQRIAEAVEERRRIGRGAARSEIDQLPELVIRCFPPDTLIDLLRLRAAILEERSSLVRTHLKWALLGCLRDVASVKVGWPYQRPGVQRRPRFNDAIRRFLERVGFMAEDVSAQVADGVARRVIRGDARSPKTWSNARQLGLAAGCVSSPPYLNNFDYADATRLEAYFWGDASTWAELCANIRSNMLTATTQQSSVGEREASLAALRDYQVGDQLDCLTRRIATERGTRKRGKQYDQVLPAYFHAIADVLSQLHRRLEPRAPVLWLVGDSAPYGVHVDTPALIGRLSTDLGYEMEADVVLRHRGGRWATASNRHSVSLTERLLVLRRE